MPNPKNTASNPTGQPLDAHSEAAAQPASAKGGVAAKAGASNPVAKPAPKQAAATRTPKPAAGRSASKSKQAPAAKAKANAAAPKRTPTAAKAAASKRATTAAKAEASTAAQSPAAPKKQAAPADKPAAQSAPEAAPAAGRSTSKAKQPPAAKAAQPKAPVTAAKVPTSKAKATAPAAPKRTPTSAKAKATASAAAKAEAPASAQSPAAPKKQAAPANKPAAQSAPQTTPAPQVDLPATSLDEVILNASAAQADEPVDFDALQTRLMALQQEVHALGIPVAIVFEGWDAAGKGTMLGELLEGLDPRGYQVHVQGKPTEEEQYYPPFRRYWMGMPAQGHISLFVGSWYREVSDACLQNKQARKQLEARYAQIVQMESQLVCDGVLLIKFFLNISKKEQKKRLKALESKKSTRWRVTKADWAQNEHYEEMMHLYDGMMAHTHFDGALWHVLRSEKKRACKKQMYDIVIDMFEKAIAGRKAKKQPWDTPVLPHVQSIATAESLSLGMFDPNQELHADYKAAIDEAQQKLRKLHNKLYLKRIPLVLGFEGWDAAGKGGSIRRLTRALDPRGYEVIPISAPTPEEKSHHHLWRFWNTIAKDGHIAIYDRTWYGRVMVERIEGFCTRPQWQRAYEEINQFEWELYSHGAIVRKFWLQISKDEQLRRFEARQATPEKQWKITDEDWRNREKWPAYEKAVNEMLLHTHTEHAPWVVVEANNKQFARLKVLHAVIEALEGALDT